MAAKSTGIDTEQNYVTVTLCITVPGGVGVVVCPTVTHTHTQHIAK